MKKFIAIVMLAVMLLSLAACAKASPYQDLIDMLDNKDYEGAIAYIYDLYEANRETDPTAEEAERLEKQYKQALSVLDNFMNNEETQTWLNYEDENGEWINESYEHNEARMKIRELFTALGDYGIAQDVVSRFTSTPDLLVKHTVEDYNSFGELSNTTNYYYNYDENGRLTEIVYWSNYTRYTYDASGNVIEVRTGYDDTTNSVTTYTYDAEGNLTETYAQYSHGSTEKTVYIYENGRIVRHEFQQNDNTPTVWVYHYNDAGQLVSRNTDQERYYYEYVYEYDAAGNLAKEEYHYWNYDWDTKTSYIDEDSIKTTLYTYEGDRLISESYSDRYGSETTTYVYGEYCAFNTEGLVIPKD